MHVPNTRISASFLHCQLQLLLNKLFVVYHKILYFSTVTPNTSAPPPPPQKRFPRSTNLNSTIDNKPFKISAGGASVFTFCFLYFLNVQHCATLMRMASALPCCILTGMSRPHSSGRASSTLSGVKNYWHTSKKGRELEEKRKMVLPLNSPLRGGEKNSISLP